MAVMIDLTRYAIRNILLQDEYAGWTRDGALALADHLLELSDDMEETLVLDVVAIRCDYNEYASLEEYYEQTGATDYDSDDIHPSDWYDIDGMVTTFNAGESAIVRA